MGRLFFLKDVAKVVAGLENNKVLGSLQWCSRRRHRRAAPAWGKYRRHRRAHQLKAVLPKLAAALPAGVKVDVAADRTGTIRASVSEVQFTLMLSVVLVVLVVLLFLRTLSATIVTAVTLPLSLIASFGVMYFAGFSLDNLSLMALTIATGFVVDDAIVMIENIMRYIEQGETPMAAAYKGAGEIGFTIVSLTVSLIAVFIPLLFMAGIVGRLFREFALTLTIAVLIPGHIAHIDSDDERRLLRPPVTRKGALMQGSPKLPSPCLHSTGPRLISCCASALTLIVAALTLVFTIVIYLDIPKGFLPDQDTGFLTAETESAAGRFVRPDESAKIGRRYYPARSGRAWRCLGSGRWHDKRHTERCPFRDNA